MSRAKALDNFKLKKKTKTRAKTSYEEYLGINSFPLIISLNNVFKITKRVVVFIY